MAAPKPTLIFSPEFSTIPTARRIDQFIGEIDAAVDSAELAMQFKQINGLSEKGWDGALSLHPHGDLR